MTHINVLVFFLEKLDNLCFGSPALRTLKESSNREAAAAEHDRRFIPYSIVIPLHFMFRLLSNHQ